MYSFFLILIDCICSMTIKGKQARQTGAARSPIGGSAAFNFKVECGAVRPQECSKAKLALANAGKRIASQILIYNPINVNVTFIETNTMCKGAFDGKFKCPCKQTSPFGIGSYVRMGKFF